MESCLAFGAVIAVIVSALKSVSAVKRYPKITAAVIASAVSAWQLAYGAAHGIDYAALAHCISTQLAGAVLTHEAVDTALGKRAPKRPY
jgi:hypothetical protein